MKNYDIAIVGFGVRGLSFIAKNKSILDYKVLIINEGKNIGVGMLPKYKVKSHTDCCDLLSYFNDSFFQDCYDKDDKLLLKQKQSVILTEINKICEKCGGKVESYIGTENILRDKVCKIEKNNDNYQIITEGNAKISSKVVILATGMKEVLSKELGKYKDKTILSGDLLNEEYWDVNLKKIKKIPSSKIVVFGGSHSALSSIEILRQMLDELGQINKIILLHRSPIIIRHENLEDASKYKDIDIFRNVTDVNKDVCRHSGKVFRQNGLKGDSKQLMIEISKNKFDNIKTVKISNPKDIEVYFENAGAIIQAIGYHSNIPPLIFSEKYKDNSIPQNLESNINGETEFENLFSIRMVRTPMGDNRPDQEDLYEKIGKSVFKSIKNLNIKKVR